VVFVEEGTFQVGTCLEEPFLEGPYQVGTFQEGTYLEEVLLVHLGRSNPSSSFSS
jgi:hypothetical protein